METGISGSENAVCGVITASRRLNKEDENMCFSSEECKDYEDMDRRQT